MGLKIRYDTRTIRKCCLGYISGKGYKPYRYDSLLLGRGKMEAWGMIIIQEFTEDIRIKHIYIYMEFYMNVGL